MKRSKGKRNLAFFLAMLMLIDVLVPAKADAQKQTSVAEFEDQSPVYSETVEQGTLKDQLTLPESLRAVIPLEGEERNGFVESTPDEKSLQSYDYFQNQEPSPDQGENGQEMPVTLYLVNRKESKDAAGKAFRRYGALPGGEVGWFASDENGNITGRVQDIPVTWSDDGFNENKAGEYKFTAEMEGYVYDGEKPFSIITVEKDSSAQENPSDVKPTEEQQKPTAEGTMRTPKDGGAGDNPVISGIELKWTSEEDSLMGRLLYDEDGVCQLKPSRNLSDLDALGTFAKASITFSFGGMENARPGEIEIRLPQYIFYNRDGNPQGAIDIGVSDEPGGSTDFLYRIDEDTQEIVLTNYQEIEPGYIFKCDIVYHSTDGKDQYPSGIEDQYKHEFDAKATVSLENQQPVSKNSDTIQVQYNTTARIIKLTKETIYPNPKYETWQDTWGKKPDDADDYFYVIWQVSGEVSATQPYSVESKDIPDGYGEVVGIGSSKDLANCAGKTDMPSYEVDIPSESATGDYKRYLSAFVLTRHPRTSLEQGVNTFENCAEMTLTGLDTASDQRSVSNSYTYVDPSFAYQGNDYNFGKTTRDTEYPGYVNKLKIKEENEPVDFGSFDVRSDIRGWGLTLEEGADTSDYSSYGKVPYEVEATDDLVTLEDERLLDGDYEFRSVDLSLIYEYNWIQDPASGTWSEERDTDYGKWEPFQIYYQTGLTGEWKLRGSLRRLENGYQQFEDTDGNITEYSSPNMVVRISLPPGSTGVQIRHETTHYKTMFNMIPCVQLYPTEHVKSLLQNDTARLYNVASWRTTDHKGGWADKQDRCVVNGYSNQAVTASTKLRDEGLYGEGAYAEHSAAYKNLSQVNTSSYASKDVTYKNDVDRSLVKTHYRADMYEKLQVKAISIPFDKDWMELQTQGILYDLLPSGMNADPSSIRVWTFRGIADYNTPFQDQFLCDITVEFIDNWRNSGRTMMVIHAAVPQDMENVISTSPNGNYTDFYSGFHLEYDAIYPWDSVQQYGTSPRNTIAYKSGVGAMGRAYPDDGGRIQDKELMKDLDGDGNPEGTLADTIYAETAKSFDFPFSAELGFTKRVKTAADTQYLLDTSAVGGGDYSYRLRLAAEENMTTKDIVLFDVLEDYQTEDETANQNRWKGDTLQSVDVSDALQKGIDAVTYYSCVPGLDMNNPADRDLTDPAKWSAVPPEDLAAVTALAFDLRTDQNGEPYVLMPEQAVSIVIHMKAPAKNVKTLEETDACAYNSGWYAGTTTSVPTNDSNYNVLESQNTAVHIREHKAELHKESDPPSGTANIPAQVHEGDTLTYDLYVTNQEVAFPLEQVKVIDTIPEGLMIDFDNIQWYSGSNPENAKLVSEATLIHAECSECTLTFVIDRLLGNETLHILVPTTVEVNDAAVQYTNTARITEAAGAAYERESETTWHKKDRELRDLTVKKVVQNQDSDPSDPSDASFAFDVTVGDAQTDPAEFTGSICDADGGETGKTVAISAGEKTKFELKDGQSIQIAGIPRNTTYTITERRDHLYDTDIVVNGEEDQKIGANGLIRQIADENQIIFYNHKKPSVPFTFTKVDAEDTDKVLPGAKFALYDLSCVDSEPGHSHDDPSDTSACWTLYQTAVSREDGTVDLGELPDGTYRLYETEAPGSYTKVSGSWELTVSCDDPDPIIITAVAEDEANPPAFLAEEDGELKLPNLQLMATPSSGGKGVLPYLTGSVLLISMAEILSVIVLRKKRRL